MSPERLDTGVYCILNIKNGKVYVGSAAVSLKRRWVLHRCYLRAGTHTNKHLRAAWKKYGEEAFRFLVLVRCQPSQCVPNEQRFIDEFGAANDKYGYNLTPTAGSQLGLRHSPEARAKMSLASRGRKLTPEQKAKIGAAHRGRRRSEETKAKMSAAQRGHPVSEEQKALLAHHARNRSPETRAKMRAARLGKKQSPEAIAKTTAANQGRKKSAEVRAILSAAQRRRAAAMPPRPMCKAEGCNRRSNCGRKGWCRTHYQRYRKHGNPLTKKLFRGDPIAAFWQKVNKDGPVHPELGACWDWTALIGQSGHGRLKIQGHWHQAHRYSWLIHFGAEPQGVFIRHKCNRPCCVNPAHLTLQRQPIV